MMMKNALLFSFLFSLILLAIYSDSFALGAIQTTSGLASYRVYQRDAAGQAQIDFKGTCDSPAQGTVQARIVGSQTGRVLREWHIVGRVEKNTLTGKIADIPAGGPYAIDLAIVDAKGVKIALQSFEQILVGDLWILAGQSNMQGIGELNDVEEPSIFVNVYGYDEKWSIAADPLHWLLDSIDPVHHQGLSGDALEKRRISDKQWARTGAGLGLPFAKALVRATGVPVGLVPCAHGGTSLEQWDPVQKTDAGLSLYGSMYRRFNVVGGKVKGVLWYQGEAETNAQAAPLYKERMEKFIAAVRRDFGDADLPFYQVQLGRYIITDENPSWSSIREQQRQLALSIPNVGTVAAIDLDMDDTIHISTAGQKRLGNRLAQLALRNQSGHNEISSGPELSSITLVPNRSLVYRLNCKNVNGGLQTAGRASGFSIRDENERDLHLIFKTLISDDGQCIDLYLPHTPPAGAVLWYGYGVDPYCNIVDQRDLALLAFGPVYLDEASYAAFISRVKENPADGDLLRLLPQAISILHRKPETKTELLVQIQSILNKANASDRPLIFPYLFALGDFQYYSEWMQQVNKADLQRRKQLASAWSAAADFPQLACPYVNKYLIAGAFDNSQDKGFDKVFSPEKTIKISGTVPDAIGGPTTWKPAQTDLNGFLNFLNNFPQQENVVAYAVVRVIAEKDAEIPVLLGSDDGAAVWVNGGEIYREHAHRAARPAQDIFPASFKKGENLILVKVEQGGGDWGLYLQLVDKDKILRLEE